MTRGKGTRSAAQTRPQSGVERSRAKDGPTAGTAICGATNRAGNPCGKLAGFGTDHFGAGRCKYHGGASPNGRVHAAREQATAEAAKFGIAIETDPHEALAAIVGILAGQVGFLQRKATEIEEGKELDADSLHPTIRALNSVLEQWQRASKAAADAGVAKRRADLNELVVVGLAEAVKRAIADVGTLTTEQETDLLIRLGHHVQALDEIDDWRAPKELVR